MLWQDNCAFFVLMHKTITQVGSPRVGSGKVHVADDNCSHIIYIPAESFTLCICQAKITEHQIGAKWPQGFCMSLTIFHR